MNGTRTWLCTVRVCVFLLLLSQLMLSKAKAEETDISLVKVRPFVCAARVRSACFDARLVRFQKPEEQPGRYRFLYKMAVVGAKEQRLAQLEVRVYACRVCVCGSQVLGTVLPLNR